MIEPTAKHPDEADAERLREQARRGGLPYPAEGERPFWTDSVNARAAREREEKEGTGEALKTDRPQGVRAKLFADETDPLAAAPEPERSNAAESAGIFEDDRNEAREPEEAARLTAPEAKLSRRARARIFMNRVVSALKARDERRRLSDVPDQKAEKKKQVKNFGIAGAALVAAIAMSIWFLGPKTAAQKSVPEKPHASDFRIAPQTLEKQSFQKHYEEKLEALGERVASQSDTIQELANRIKRLTGEGKDVAVPVNALPDYSPEALAAQSRTASGTDAAGRARTRIEPARMGVVKVAPVDAEPAARSSAAVRPAPRRLVADTPIAANRARHEAKNAYLPAGSFMKASVLAGVVAPTGGNAAANPVPMLLEIRDFAHLPNAFRAAVKHCFVTATAAGDLSSERVWVRLDRLSCMTREGRAIDVRVQGYATGEDGKTGVRARLVTRSGQAIASALFTGAISGLGKAVSMSAQTSVTYSSGATGTTVNDGLKAGLGEGVSDAMDRIVDYYLKLADKIFPVLELDSGRRLELVLSQGVTVALDEEEDSVRATTTVADEPSINSAQLFGERVRSQRTAAP